MKPVLEVKVEDKQTDLECYPQEATTGARMDISMWRIAKECELDHLIPKVSLPAMSLLLHLLSWLYAKL